MGTEPTALVAEDEPMLREMLKTRLAESWPELSIIGEASNGEDALVMAQTLRPDIAFLDVRMPLRSGLEVARDLGARCHVVFVTAYDEYAVSAFEQGAVDYALKPPTRERIDTVVQRLKSRLSMAPPDLSGLLTKLAGREAGPAPLKWVRASLGASMRVIDVDDILYSRPRTSTPRS